MTPSEMVRAFERSARQGPFAARAVSYYGGTGNSLLTLCFCVHGNEHGSLPALLRLQAELDAGTLVLAEPLALVLGNPEAVQADVRFLEEDLNRVFTFDRPASSLERRRAEELRPLLDQTEVLLDFHQTQTPTEHAFWTFPWLGSLGLWARALGVTPHVLTRRSEQSFAAGQLCLDEYVRDRGKPGITVELGMRGQDESQAEACYQAARRAISLHEATARYPSALENAAAAAPPLQLYRTAHVVKKEPPHLVLRPGFQNFSPISRGERLSDESSPEVLAPVSGKCLFPKYASGGHPTPHELMRIAVPIESAAEL